MNSFVRSAAVIVCKQHSGAHLELDGTGFVLVKHLSEVSQVLACTPHEPTLLQGTARQAAILLTTNLVTHVEDVVCELPGISEWEELSIDLLELYHLISKILHLQKRRRY
jgi:hypothetical protein